MRRLLYAGSFDPPHIGHVDVIRRARGLCDELVIAVARNPEKPGAFPTEERVRLLERCLQVPGLDALDGIRVIEFEGLVSSLASAEDCTALLRSVRGAADVEFEHSMADMNRKLGNGELETVFLFPSPEHATVSSSWIRQIAAFAGDVRHLLPPAIADDVQKSLSAPQNPRTPPS